MVEFTNRNLRKTEPDYFYLVREYVTTFGKDKGKREPYVHKQTFKNNDLLKCRAEAEKYYYERLKGLEEGATYFLPFAAPKDFVLGENAAFSITLSFVEYYNEDEEYEYDLVGQDEGTIAESREIETAVLRDK